MKPKPLPTGYYLENFFKILDFVDEYYDDILNSDELVFSRAFRDLPLAAQRLYVRFISRKGPLFRSDRLNYPEIENLERAAAQLSQAGFLETNPSLEVGHLLRLLTRPEVIALIRQCGQYESQSNLNKYRKPELLEMAEALEPSAIQGFTVGLFHWHLPLQTEILLIYRLLFFGNLGQDLTEFVLLDLGLVRYEAYEIRRQDRLFESRAVLEDTLAWIELGEAVREALGEDYREFLETVRERLPSDHGEPSLIRRRNRILNACGHYFERRKDDAAALAHYAESSRHPARERRIRIHFRRGELEHALALCETVIAAPEREIELSFARKFLPKIRKKSGLSADSPTPVRHPTTSLTLPRAVGKAVEQAVLEAEQGRGVEGFYAENRFWLGLFGLAFWDIIFMSVKGAFFNRFQRGPKGLFRSEFRQQRAPLIEERLRDIVDNPDWATSVMARYDQKNGVANYLVHWPYFSRENLTSVLQTFDRNHIAAIFDRLSRNPGEFKSGFPDLILFDSSPAGYVLAEVKGPGDQLQANQRRWLRFFKSQKIPYRVLRVKWAVD